MDQGVKEEVQKLLAQQKPAPKLPFSRLFLKLGAGYAAMALFTAAALVYTSVNLYLINSSIHKRIATTDIPVVTALIKMRSSLLVQENFRGKYAIFRDPGFIELFRQRHNDVAANLALLERSRSVPNIALLQKLYRDYHNASETLFTAQPQELGQRVSALQLIALLDELYLERQALMQTLLDVADEQQVKTVRWGIGISCAGFLLAFVLARVSVYRVDLALRNLQKETHRIASGNFQFHPLVPSVAEIRDLVDDFNQIAGRILNMEQASQEAEALSRLPGNQAIERVIETRLASGTPFSVCHLEVDDFPALLAQYGYAASARLVFETGALCHRIVAEFGAPEDFAGHAGGERFVLVLARERVETACQALIAEFAAQAAQLLPPASGSGTVQGRRPSVSLAVIDCDGRSCVRTLEITRAAVQLGKDLQQGEGGRWQRIEIGG